MIKLIIEAFTGVGTLALAGTSFYQIRQNILREKRKYRPMVTLDFQDQEGEAWRGCPGLRLTPEAQGTTHLQVSGVLKNLASTPAVDCSLDVYIHRKDGSKPDHVLKALLLSNGLGSGESSRISKLSTLIHILDTDGQNSSLVDIASLFNMPDGVSDGYYPSSVVLSYKNSFGDHFFTVYSIRRTSMANESSQVGMEFQRSMPGLFSDHLEEFRPKWTETDTTQDEVPNGVDPSQLRKYEISLPRQHDDRIRSAFGFQAYFWHTAKQIKPKVKKIAR